MTLCPSQRVSKDDDSSVKPSYCRRFCDSGNSGVLTKRSRLVTYHSLSMVELRRLLQLRPGLTEKDPPSQRGKGHKTPVPFLQQTPLMLRPQWGLKEGSFAPHLPHLPKNWTWPKGLLLLRIFRQGTPLYLLVGIPKRRTVPQKSAAHWPQKMYYQLGQWFGSITMRSGWMGPHRGQLCNTYHSVTRSWNIKAAVLYKQ